MGISLLEMGRIKKRNVREAILSILTKEFPLSIKKVYNRVQKNYGLNVTYQAVFKVLNEMVEDRVLIKENKEYLVNVAWIRDLEEEIGSMKYAYGVKTKDYKDEEMKERIEYFISSVGPRIKDYLGKDEGHILVMHYGGGGNAIWKRDYKISTKRGL